MPSFGTLEASAPSGMGAVGELAARSQDAPVGRMRMEVLE